MRIKRALLTRDKLDGTVVDIEFLLIAVIQGLALTTLAVASEDIIAQPQWLYWPYMVAGFILICNFWTLSMVHSISFIRWPFDPVHTLLYMLVAFVEVSAFSQLTHPDRWFIFMLAFFVITAVLYAWDMRMIVDKRDEFEDSAERLELYAHIYERHHMELTRLIPAGVAFQLVVVVLMFWNPGMILSDHRDLWLIGLQVVFGLLYLADAIRNYGARRELIEACIEEPAHH